MRVVALVSGARKQIRQGINQSSSLQTLRTSQKDFRHPSSLSSQAGPSTPCTPMLLSTTVTMLMTKASAMTQ